MIDEEELEKEIVKGEEEEKAGEGKDQVVEKYQKQLINLEIKELDLKLAKSKTYDSLCHTWFIAKDIGVDINWKKPLLQKSQIRSYIKIAEDPFAEGAMRYAFMMED